jgi:glycosyltransferase involved in cell wall biosynthesis
MTTARIIVPCYNEAERLKPDLFLQVLESNERLSFLFVNDGSRDGTLECLYALREKAPTRVAVLDLERNVGKAEAVRCGFLASLDEPCDYVGYWDADLATPLDAIAEFCSILDRGNVEAVIGSRVCLLGRNIQRNPWRHYVGRVFATCASLLLQLKIYDTQCGAKLFKNAPILRQVFGSPFKVNWTFDVEMMARFLVLQGTGVASRWVEHPLHEWVDVKGSKIRAKDYLKGGMEFLTIFWYLRTPARSSYLRHLAVPVPAHGPESIAV